MPRQVMIEVPNWDVLTIVRQQPPGQPVEYTIDVGYAVKVQGEEIAANESTTVRGSDLSPREQAALTNLDAAILALVRAARGF